MMNRKNKGTKAERELISMFLNTGTWIANRIAGSGSCRHPSPDIIAGNVKRKIAMECKATSDSKQYLSKKQVEGLKEYCALFGAEPWIGVRFDNLDWYFLTLEDLQETEGENYVVTIPLAKRRGLLFEELIGIF